MTLKEFLRVKEILDSIGIYYEDGNYYDCVTEEITGHWLEIKEALIETMETED